MSSDQIFVLLRAVDDVIHDSCMKKKKKKPTVVVYPDYKHFSACIYVCTCIGLKLTPNTLIHHLYIICSEYERI